MYKPALTAGTFFAALAVVLGAFGAHALKAKLPPEHMIEQLAVYETGIRYQFYHSFALITAGIVFSSFPHKSLKLAANFFIIGIILFSGSLYAMTLLSMTTLTLGPLGIITPVGGLFLIAGWALFLSGIIRNK